MTRTLLHRLSPVFRPLAALLVSTLPALAIDGGRLAAHNRLTQATVAIGTLTAGDDDRLGLSRCSGVLIGPTTVLTAAHCVRGDPLASVVVFYDGSRPVRPAIRVTSVERNDVDVSDLPADYAKLLTLSLDTAVLRLASPARGRVPLRIGRGRRAPGELRLAGAGISAEGIGTLKTTRLEPLAVTQAGLIIARARGSEVCKGDSGGPVVADGPGGPVLWGVASAVLSGDGQCGRILVVAPAAPRL